MAQPKNSVKNNRKINNLANNVKDNMDSLYKNTYYSSPQLKNDLNDLAKDINSNLDRIVNNNLSTIGMPNISKMYNRIDMGKGRELSNRFMDKIEDLFEDTAFMDDLYSSFMENRFLADLDQEIDTVCKYMPTLDEALEIKKDNVLSADHFSKDFINVATPMIGDETTFNERIKSIKEGYNIQEIIEDIYDRAAKYGEQFVYIVPYQKAFQKLLSNKPQTTLATIRMEGSKLTIESNKNGKKSNSIVKENACVFNEEVIDNKGNKSIQSISMLNQNQSFNISIELNESGIIDSLVRNTTRIRNIMSESSYREQSVWFTEADNKDIKVQGNLSFDGMDDERKSISSKDGLIQSSNDGTDPNKIKIKTPGCIVKLVNRSQVVPVYIDDICMGYYYIEFRTADMSEELMGFKNILGDPLTNMKNNGGRNNISSIESSRQEEVLRFLSGQMSQFIDKNFINNNQDLRKEIYMILKYNDIFNTPNIDKVKVTFVHPEDMIHVYFRQDPISHRGISDLDRALIPAKIYSSLYVTNSIGVMTRGQDKRVYYVKQTVENNIAKTLLNTIAQIKQGNFGIRQFQNINSVLNITGRFNDYVIPTNSNNDPPIQFEVMPGQNIDVKTDLMNMLEEMAVNSTDIPIDVVRTRQSMDFAIQASMSNSKVLRKVYKRQSKYQPFVSKIVNKIYNSEYNENISFDVSLPPPMFLNMTNTTQMMDNTENYVTKLVEMENDLDDNEKAIYKKDLLEYHLGSYIDISKNKLILDRSKIKAKMQKKESDNTEE